MQHRLIPVAALFATSLPLCALAGGQLPADSLATHPATSAQAVAAAGQADAMRIESCVASTNALIDNLQKGDYQAATGAFDATMQTRLDAEKLGKLWQQVKSQTGTLQSRGQARNALYEGDVVITLPLHFQKASLDAQVACDKDNRIGGFFLRPATSG